MTKFCKHVLQFLAGSYTLRTAQYRNVVYIG